MRTKYLKITQDQLDQIHELVNSKDAEIERLNEKLKHSESVSTIEILKAQNAVANELIENLIEDNEKLTTEAETAEKLFDESDRDLDLAIKELIKSGERVKVLTEQLKHSYLQIELQRDINARLVKSLNECAKTGSHLNTVDLSSLLK